MKTDIPFSICGNIWKLVFSVHKICWPIFLATILKVAAADSVTSIPISISTSIFS